MHNKEEYVIHIRNLKQALNYELVLKKVHTVRFNLKTWLKKYIDINTDLTKKAQNDFEKYFFKLRNNATFGKTMENVRKRTGMKLVTTEARRDYLVSEPNCHKANFFSENLLVIEMRKTQIHSKPVYLGLSILELIKIVVYEFWCDYIKAKYREKVKLCLYKYRQFHFVYIKTDIYKDIAEDIETRFDTLDYELDRPLPKEKK